MSTRSQLRFVQDVASAPTDEPSADRRVAQIYRHSDGYPTGVIADLTRLRRLLEATGTVRDPAYTAATFVFLDKLSTLGMYLNHTAGGIPADEPADVLDTGNMEHLDQPLFLLGHGVENPADGIHGDEEYLYVVELPSREQSRDEAAWTVRVSTHCGFPRWDGPTAAAFERADWQFTGSLDAARSRFDVTGD